MAQLVVNFECPGCGAPVSTSDKTCNYCKGPVTISTFNSVASLSLPDITKYANSYNKALAANPADANLRCSAGMCYLKLRLYDKALPAFEATIASNFDGSEAYFYAAVCLLKGQKAFLATRPVIDKAMEYLNAALMIEPRGIYHYFMAYIKYDYFSRKFFKISPDYQETLQMASAADLSEHDINQLFEILGVARPSVL